MRAARPFQLSRILFRSANEPYWRRFTERRQSSNHDHYQDHENEVFGYGESPKIKFRLGKGTVKNIHSSKSPLRRAFFYVPASSSRFIEKALKSKADCIVLDLEDGVAESQKSKALSNVKDLLHRLHHEGYRDGENMKANLCLRVNHKGWEEGEWGDPGNPKPPSEELDNELDVFATPEGERLSLVLPKANRQRDLYNVHDVIAKKRYAYMSKNDSLQFRVPDIVPLVESPLGRANIDGLRRYNRWSIRWTTGLVFAAEDYCTEMGIQRTEDLTNLLPARNAVVEGAKILGVPPIDMVCQDFKNPDILRKECENGLYFGFEGKQCIHPDQIDIIQEVFAPKPEDVKWAMRLMQAVGENSEKGAIEFEGKMMDKPMFVRAEKILARAERIAEHEKYMFKQP